MEQAEAPRALRVTEWILAAYFGYTALLALVLALSAPARLQSLCASLGAVGVLLCLARWPRRLAPDTLRNILPIGGVLLAYKQMGWFAQPKTDYSLEQSWVQWDRLVLEDWGVSRAIESLGPVGPGVLEVLYLLTYAVAPLGLLLLYSGGLSGRADRLLAAYVASAVVAYALYPYFPSEPPRTVFPGDLSGPYETVFKQLNWWLLGGAGIHTSVFPSGHVSSAFGIGFGLLHAAPGRKAWGIAMLAVAAGIGVATVYCRYHYAVDALAGVVTSIVASLGCVCAFRIRERRGRAGIAHSAL